MLKLAPNVGAGTGVGAGIPSLLWPARRLTVGEDTGCAVRAVSRKVDRHGSHKGPAEAASVISSY